MVYSREAQTLHLHNMQTHRAIVQLRFQLGQDGEFLKNQGGRRLPLSSQAQKKGGSLAQEKG